MHYQKIDQLWRKLWRKIFEIVTKKLNLWRKLWRKALRYNFIRHKLICDGSTDKSPSQFFVTEILCHKNFVTDFFRHKKICDGNCDGMSVTIFGGGIAPGEVFCDGLGDVCHKIVTESVTFRHNLWRRITNSSQFVTENFDGFPSHFSFCDGIPSQFPSENVKGNQKRPAIWSISAYAEY